MKAIFIIFDTLIRSFLSPYGGLQGGSFECLARHSTVFDRAYAGSLPCMPARRDLMTGRINFLHNSWGPLEPFERAFTQNLRDVNVYSRLVTDHYHYFEEGGNGYHTRFSSWQGVRGQEGDPWAGVVNLPNVSRLSGRNDMFRAQDLVNRRNFRTREDYPIHAVFSSAEDFIHEHHDTDRWYLQIESFSPHEPFVFHPDFGADLGFDFRQNGIDWPEYGRSQQQDAGAEYTRMCYRACVAACDHYLGRVLDLMDRYEMWEDTMLIVSTDHGFLLGERGWWGKSVQPAFPEVTHIPLFIWHPDYPGSVGHSYALAQWIDLAPTILQFFGAPILEGATGRSLNGALSGCQVGRDYALFGYFGGHCGITDGDYIYYRAPNPSYPLYRYTLAPYEMKTPVTRKHLCLAQWEPGSNWSFGSPLLRIPAEAWEPQSDEGYRHQLYHAKVGSCLEIGDSLYGMNLERGLLTKLRAAFEKEQAPRPQFDRYGIS